MAGIKETLSKGITKINIKTNNFMEITKCKTYISTLENEIDALKKKIGDVLYQGRKEKNAALSSVEEIFVEIDKRYEEIEMQKIKINELEREEQQILGESAAGAVSEDMKKTVFCSNCGTQNAAGYKFCCKCGVKINL